MATKRTDTANQLLERYEWRDGHDWKFVHLWTRPHRERDALQISDRESTLEIVPLATRNPGHLATNPPTNTRWQIFLFCGLLTVAYSIIVFLFIPDSPMEAKFLSDREKVIATERLRANQMGIAARKWRWDHVKETALDVKTYLWFGAITSISSVGLLDSWTLVSY